MDTIKLLIKKLDAEYKATAANAAVSVAANTSANANNKSNNKTEATQIYSSSSNKCMSLVIEHKMLERILYFFRAHVTHLTQLTEGYLLAQIDISTIRLSSLADLYIGHLLAQPHVDSTDYQKDPMYLALKQK